MQPTKLTDEQIQSIVRLEVQAAQDFTESEVHDERIKARRYANGEVDLEVEEGRSRVKATTVRDAIRVVKPGLMRIFMQDDPVQFAPKGMDDVNAAEQATEYVKHVFWNENSGYRVIYDGVDDALVEKTGIAKVYWDEQEETEYDEYSNLTPEQFALIEADPNVEITSSEQDEETGFYAVEVAYTRTTGKAKIVSVAPEDFFVDGSATCVEDARVIGDRCEMTVGDVLAMGDYDLEEVIEHAGADASSMDDEAEFARGMDHTELEPNTPDATQRPILVTDVYMSMDVDGTGKPRCWRLTCIGHHYHVLDREPADQVPYVVGSIDPRPHAFFGTALADLLIDDTDAQTSLRRALVDNVQMVNSPRWVVNTQLGGSVEDAANNEIGAILRADSPGAYEPIATPPTASAILPAMEYYDATIEAKTGVSRAAAGIDADALVNTSATAANLANQAQTAAVELMARNFAETFMRPLFRKLLKLIRQHSDPNQMVRMNGQFVQVDPRSWNADMDVVVNVGLGANRQEERAQALMETLDMQQAVMSMLGPVNPLVSLAHVRAAREDLNKLRGVHDTDRYFAPLQPEIEQQMNAYIQQAAQQMAQQMQQQGGGEYIAGEQIKAQQRDAADQRKQQTELLKARAEAEADLRELAVKDDRERDKMVQDLALEVARILGEHSIRVDEQAVRAQQQATQPLG